jgi:hypothetical protein
MRTPRSLAASAVPTACEIWVAIGLEMLVYRTLANP